jgi:hypothetical protein
VPTDRKPGDYRHFRPVLSAPHTRITAASAASRLRRILTPARPIHDTQLAAKSGNSLRPLLRHLAKGGPYEPLGGQQ